MQEFSGVRSILVIVLRRIGDVLLSVPVFSALRENFPNARITALVNHGTGQVLYCNPAVDAVIPYRKDGIRGEFGTAMALRAGRFDMTVSLAGGDRAAALAFFTGAGIRLAFDPGGGRSAWKRLLYTHLVPKSLLGHKVLRNLDLLGRFGIRARDRGVRIYLSGEEIDSAEGMLIEGGMMPGDKVVHVHPMSMMPVKRWDAAKTAEVIRGLASEGARVVLTASSAPDELVEARRILSMVPGRSRVIDLSGRVSLRELAAVSALSSAFLGVDSAPAHIAAALGTPVVALFGPSKSYRWGPWDNASGNEAGREPYLGRGVQSFGAHNVIQRDWECVPCRNVKCPHGGVVSRCLMDIEVDEALGAVIAKAGLGVGSRQEMLTL